MRVFYCKPAKTFSAAASRNHQATLSNKQEDNTFYHTS